MPNFMLQDIFYTLIAFPLLSLFTLIPGYVIGWASNILLFRQRRFLTRLLLAIVLSVAVVPAFTYLVARLTHLQTMWWIFIPFWFAFFWLILPNIHSIKLPKERWTRWAIGLTGLWVFLAVFSLSDLQFGQELFFNVVAFDWSHRVAITDAIARTGIPPANPFFYPGEPVYVSYYYFWSIIPALLTQLTGRVITSRIAFLAASIWCGVALRAVAALYLRFHEPEGQQHIVSRSGAAILLFLFTGLDIIFISILLIQVPDSPVITEWWNGNAQITAWSGLIFWAPNHVASLIACITGLIFLQRIKPQTLPRDRVIASAVTGISLASALGMSIYVVFVFAAFWVLWFLFSLIMKETRYKAVWLALTGLLGLFFAFPFLVDTLKNREFINTGTSLFSLGIRPLYLIENNSLVQNLIPSELLLNFIHLICLPVNYFLELGFFMLAGILFLHSCQQTILVSESLRIDILLLLTSVLICSFIKSSIIENNDLGWRGFLPAQFVLLIWSANFLVKIFPQHRRNSNIVPPLRISRFTFFVLFLTFFIGLASSIFDILHLRFFMVMHDQQFWLTSQGGVYPANYYGNETYSLRQAYQFIDDELPKNWMVQNNPVVPNIEIAQGIYGNRQSVVSGPGTTTYGVSQLDYYEFANLIAPIFTDKSISAKKVNELCSRHNFKVIIVSHTDPVWNQKMSWVWQNPSVFQTPYVRLFECDSIIK